MRNSAILTLTAAAIATFHVSTQAADAAPATRAAAAAPSPAATLDAAGEGRRLYLKLNCYSCHGDRAGGAMGPNIVHAESGDVTEAVRQGEGGGMPSYRNYVTATDLANLTAYLRSIGTATEPKFRDWWIAIPPK